MALPAPSREYSDTDPRAMEVWLRLQREMTPAERVARALELSDLACEVSRAGTRAAYPAASPREIFLRAAARWLPRDLMIAAYGWDPSGEHSGR